MHNSDPVEARGFSTLINKVSVEVCALLSIEHGPVTDSWALTREMQALTKITS